MSNFFTRVISILSDAMAFVIGGVMAGIGLSALVFMAVACLAMIGLGVLIALFSTSPAVADAGATHPASRGCA